MTTTNLLRVGQVARQLDCSVWVVHKLIRLRQLKAVNISTGKKPVYRVADSDLATYIRKARKRVA